MRSPASYNYPAIGRNAVRWLYHRLILVPYLHLRLNLVEQPFRIGRGLRRTVGIALGALLIPLVLVSALLEVLIDLVTAPLPERHGERDEWRELM